MIVQFEPYNWGMFLKEIIHSYQGNTAHYYKEEFEHALGPFNAKHIFCTCSIDFESEEDYVMFKLKYGI